MEASESSAEPAAPWSSPEQSPADAHAAAVEADAFAKRPEVYVGAAFAGGLGVALVLRWLGSR